MKSYVITILENQYNVLEVGESDKIGVYQVDESMVHKMHKQSTKEIRLCDSGSRWNSTI